MASRCDDEQTPFVTRNLAGSRQEIESLCNVPQSVSIIINDWHTLTTTEMPTKQIHFASLRYFSLCLLCLISGGFFSLSLSPVVCECLYS